MPREMSAVIKDLPKGKSPGPNGFTNAYYTSFHTLLSSWMCAYFNDVATDIKLLAKILAIYLKPVLPTVIHLDQTDFLAGREAQDNFNHAIQLIHWAQLRMEHPLCLLLSPKRRLTGYNGYISRLC